MDFLKSFNRLTILAQATVKLLLFQIKLNRTLKNNSSTILKEKVHKLTPSKKQISKT